ncbi:MAG: type IV toxin-antitoxin system AbiEi family antitoxin domain-containing protein [Actinomycetota bacterium]|nr:type IV toxin-antitoxin system AbiEi family antitoxin domain-containing protein [Actinomycetota bacterium]
MSKKDQSLWTRAVERAANQHGMVARRQLLAFGMTPQAIYWALRSGRLHRTEWRGVYALGRPERTRYGRWMGAVLAYGGGAVLSHDTAGALWRIWKPRDHVIHLSLPAVGQRRKRRGVTVHRRNLRAGDITHEHGIPVTRPLRTVVDLAATCDRRQAEALVNDADARNVLRAGTLMQRLAGMKGQPGVPLLLEILDPATFVLTDSELERRFLPLARAAGLPKPLTRVMVNGWRVDFYWPHLNLVVEVHGLRYHRTAVQQTRDAAREHAHAVAETEAAGFTYHQVARERAYVVEHLSLRAARASSRVAASA